MRLYKNNVGWSGGYHLLLLKDFGPNVTIFTKVCVVITVAMVGDHLLLRDFESYGILLPLP
jgi:hypothetical protein